MIRLGLLEEAKNLYEHKNLYALQTVGYKELFDHFEGKNTLHEAVELIKRNTRRYAKRQLTFLRGFTKKILALNEQKKTIVLHSCSDHVDISYPQVARLVGCLQK